MKYRKAKKHSKFNLNQIKESAKLFLTNNDITKKVDYLLSNCNADLKRTSIKEFLKKKNEDDSILLTLFQESKNQEEYHKYLFFLDLSLKNGKKKKKVFISAGEHPRELIPVDTITTFLENLCSNDRKGDILDKFDFRFVLNANPISRSRVLNGEYCLRANPNKVDINRNWDVEFGNKIEFQEEYCGDTAFNQVETTFLRESISDFNPFVFLAIHSGTMAMYHPQSYSTETDFQKSKWGLFTINQISSIKSKFCKDCDVGLPFFSLGYYSTGSAMDYVHEYLDVPIAMTWEIYDIEKFPELRRFLKKKTNKISFIHKREAKKLDNNKYNIESRSKFNRNFEELKPDINSKSDLIECFDLFNPLSKDSYNFTIEFWNNILDAYFIGLSEELNKNKKTLK